MGVPDPAVPDFVFKAPRPIQISRYPMESVSRKLVPNMVALNKTLERKMKKAQWNQPQWNVVNFMCFSSSQKEEAEVNGS